MTQTPTPAPNRRGFSHPDQEKLVFGNRPRHSVDHVSPNQGFLVEMPYGWLLVTARGSTRGVLRKDHGWTEQTAQEALRLQEGDILL